MRAPLPLWTNWIAGLLLVTFFTGSWVLLNDLKKVHDVPTSGCDVQRMDFVLAKLRVRRVLSLLGGLAIIVAYFADTPLTVGAAIIFGVFYLAALSLMAEGRRLVNEAERRP